MWPLGLIWWHFCSLFLSVTPVAHLAVVRETASMETPSALYGVCFWFNAFFITHFFLRFYEKFAVFLDILVIYISSHPCSQILGVSHTCTPICVIPSGLMMWLCCQFRSQTPSVYLISCSCTVQLIQVCLNYLQIHHYTDPQQDTAFALWLNAVFEIWERQQWSKTLGLEERPKKKKSYFSRTKF